VDRGIQVVTEELAQLGISVQSAREARFSLEDVFISIVEQAREQGKVPVDA
jgi:regulator of sigma D